MIMNAVDNFARECGSCVACCKVLGVPSLQKPRGVLCINALCGGCSIYKKRPQECADWKCEWLKGKYDDAERPDKLGLVVDTNPQFKRKWGQDAITVHELFPGARFTREAKRFLDRIYEAGAFICLIPPAPDPGRTFLCTDKRKITQAMEIATR